MAWSVIFILSYLNLILNQYGTILTWDIDTIRLLHSSNIAMGYLQQSSQSGRRGWYPPRIIFLQKNGGCNKTSINGQRPTSDTSNLFILYT
jgi:hypothetical protein